MSTSKQKHQYQLSVKRRNLFEDNERQSKTQPRKVQFKKGTRSPPPANKDQPHMVRTIDGKMLIPHSHLKKSEKNKVILNSHIEKTWNV